MTITQTTVRPKWTDGAGESKAIYRITFDDSYPTGGEDITVSDFSVVYGAKVIGATAIADNAFNVKAVCTGTAADCKLTVFWNEDPEDTGGGGTTDVPDVEYTSTGNLVAVLVGPINVLVIGK